MVTIKTIINTVATTINAIISVLVTSIKAERKHKMFDCRPTCSLLLPIQMIQLSLQPLVKSSHDYKTFQRCSFRYRLTGYFYPNQSRRLKNYKLYFSSSSRIDDASGHGELQLI